MGKPSPSYKVVLVGCDGVGKSTLVQQFTRKKYAIDEHNKKVEHQTTVELKLGVYSNVDIINSREDDFAAIRNHEWSLADGFLCVFSLTDLDSFKAVAEFREQILKSKESIPLLLVGNKADLNVFAAVKSDQARQQAAEWNIPYVETSAKTKQNVEDAFMQLLREIQKRRKLQKKAAKKHKLKKCVIV